MHCDVLVVGAGPAGAACARHLALGGASVILADRTAVSVGKPCGEYLSPQGFQKLEALGVLDEILRQPHMELEGVRLTGRHGAVLGGRDTRFMGHAPSHPRGLAIERRLLDPSLRRKAEETPGLAALAGGRIRRDARHVDDNDRRRDGGRGGLGERGGGERRGAERESGDRRCLEHGLH